jgi:serine/threonine protein kinase
MEDKVITVGGYSFVKKGLIGTGSFAEVYKAEHVTTGQCVAIKIVDVARLTRGSENLRKHLGSEINIMKTLHHENIVKLLDVFMVRI